MTSYPALQFLRPENLSVLFSLLYLPPSTSLLRLYFAFLLFLSHEMMDISGIPCAFRASASLENYCDVMRKRVKFALHFEQ
jgi:hypothetical protein